MITPAAAHEYMFEVWPDPMPAASYPMTVPDHVTVRAAGYEQAREAAITGLAAGRALGFPYHQRSRCTPPHPSRQSSSR